MKNTKLIFLFSIFLFLNCIKESNGSIKLHSENKFFKTKEIHFFKSEKNLTIEDLFRLSNENIFSIKKAEYLSFGITQSFVYIYFDIEREDQSEWILELPYPPLTHIKVYQVDKYENIYSHESGITFFSEQRYSEHPFYQFPLIEQPGKIRIYLQLKANDPLTTPIFLWNKNTLNQIDGYRHLAFGLFFGILLSLAFYNLLLLITIRDKTYLYYVCYILSFCFFFLFVYGYAGYLFRSFINKFHFQLMPFFAILTSVFALLFTRRFLNAKIFSPTLYKLYQYFIWIGAILLLSAFLLPVDIIVILANLHPLVAIGFVISSCIIAVKNKYKPAIYFIIAWSGLLLSVILYILSNLTIIPANFFTHYLQILGVTFEAILLSLALGYRINDLKSREEETRQEALRQEIASREKQERLSLSFKRFVPGEFLKNLQKESILDIRQGDSISCHMAVLFTDIRGFTNLSEKLESEKVFTFLNQYLEKMEPIIQKYNGFIDKFIGDAIMALFPDESNATLAAMEMVLVSNQIDLPDESSLQVGIGIHAGELILGTIGSPSRIDTTVIGDTVNLASRIESLNKQYGTKLLISEDIFLKVQNQDILIREIDLVRVKGKAKPILIYEIICNYSA